MVQLGQMRRTAQALGRVHIQGPRHLPRRLAPNRRTALCIPGRRRDPRRGRQVPLGHPAALRSGPSFARETARCCGRHTHSSGPAFFTTTVGGAREARFERVGQATLLRCTATEPPSHEDRIDDRPTSVGRHVLRGGERSTSMLARTRAQDWPPDAVSYKILLRRTCASLSTTAPVLRSDGWAG
jgi:hypothetical protein